MFLWITEAWSHEEGDDDDDDDDEMMSFVVWEDEGEVRRTSRLNEWFH